MKGKKSKFVIDLQPETHRDAEDCTCVYCLQEETKEYIINRDKKIDDEFFQFQKEWGKTNSEVGRMS